MDSDRTAWARNGERKSGEGGGETKGGLIVSGGLASRTGGGGCSVSEHTGALAGPSRRSVRNEGSTPVGSLRSPGRCGRAGSGRGRRERAFRVEEETGQDSLLSRGLFGSHGGWARLLSSEWIKRTLDSPDRLGD